MRLAGTGKRRTMLESSIVAPSVCSFPSLHMQSSQWVSESVSQQRNAVGLARGLLDRFAFQLAWQYLSPTEVPSHVPFCLPALVGRYLGSRPAILGMPLKEQKEKKGARVRHDIRTADPTALTRITQVHLGYTVANSAMQDPSPSSSHRLLIMDEPLLPPAPHPRSPD